MKERKATREEHKALADLILRIESQLGAVRTDYILNALAIIGVRVLSQYPEEMRDRVTGDYIAAIQAERARKQAHDVASAAIRDIEAQMASQPFGKV
jgi:hypothetical protein